MSVNEKDTLHVAKLARLGLSDAEKDLFTRQLNDILQYIDVINSIDTGNISPTAHAQLKDRKTPMREDEAAPFNDIERILDIAPLKEAHMFRVPKILESEENGAF